MRNSIIAFAGGSVVIIAAVVLGFVVVKPVLAQVDATSTESEVPPVESVETVAASDAPAPEEPSEPASEPVVTGAEQHSTTVESSASEPPAESSSLQVAPIEPRSEGLTEVRVIGTKYIDYFTDGTNTYTFPGDPEIHAHIAEKDAPIPTHEGLTWLHSIGQYQYDTTSGA